jgi:hypothetical protein
MDELYFKFWINSKLFVQKDLRLNDVKNNVMTYRFD